MLDFRLHLVLGLSILMLLAAPLPGAPGPAAARAALEWAKATRPEPIEVEPIGSRISGDAGELPGW